MNDTIAVTKESQAYYHSKETPGVIIGVNWHILSARFHVFTWRSVRMSLPGR
jgi:hypothetical protein